MSEDPELLLADLLTALFTYQHELPAAIVGRVLVAVG